MARIETERIREATERITSEEVLGILKPLSEKLAPSGTVSITRGLSIAKIWGGPGFDENYKGTGNPVINPEASGKLFVAHADQISYFIPQETDSGEVELKALCAHRATPGVKHSALVLRYLEKNEALEVVAQGQIGTTDERKPYFVGGGSLPRLKIGDRVVYDLPLEEGNGFIKGTSDNAAGMAACLAAALTLKEIAKDAGLEFEKLGASFVFTDEEEGVPTSNATFGRGMRRYLRKNTGFPELMINVDSHDVKTLGNGALYAGVVSGGKGAVVPPQLYVPFRNFMQGLENKDIKSAPTELVGSVSRSDDVGMMEVSPNILIVGYGTKHCHFDGGIEEIYLPDLVDLSKAIVWTALEFEPFSH